MHWFAWCTRCICLRCFCSWWRRERRQWSAFLRFFLFIYFLFHRMYIVFSVAMPSCIKLGILCWHFYFSISLIKHVLRCIVFGSSDPRWPYNGAARDDAKDIYWRMLCLLRYIICLVFHRFGAKIAAWILFENFNVTKAFNEECWKMILQYRIPAGMYNAYIQRDIETEKETA